MVSRVAVAGKPIRLVTELRAWQAGTSIGWVDAHLLASALMANAGIVRLRTWLVPTIARWPHSDENGYSAEDLKLIRLTACWRAFNRNIVNDQYLLQENLAPVRAMRFPEGLPVLLFVSRQAADNVRHAKRRDWLEMQEDKIRHGAYAKAVMLPGDHCLLWNCSRRMAAGIRAFFEGLEAR